MTRQIFAVALSLTLGITFHQANAQSKYLDKSCDISFYSKTSFEDIAAKNSSAVSVMDIQSGDIQFAILIKAFEFDRALMQEHFNENYMESEKFPKATFKGQIKNISSVNFKADGSYPVNVSGTLTMHGVSKEISIEGTIKVSGGNIEALSAFAVNPADYDIEIPSVVKDKIAKEIQVKVDANLQPYIN